MRMGHTVTIFAASMVHNSEINLITDQSLYREETIEGIHYVYIKTCFYNNNGAARIRNMFQFARRLPEVCRHFDRPDVIIASSATPLACMAGIKLAKRYDCRVIAEISDLWPESFVAYGLIGKKNPLLKPMYAYEKRIYAKADAIIFTMEGGRDYITEKRWDKAHRGPVDLRKVYHLNNGVDLEVFDYNREHYTVDDPDLEDASTFKVIYTGSIRLTNNLDVLVQAAKIAKNLNINDLKFIIYGEGDQKDRLVKLCHDLGLTNIKFKGAVSKKNIPYILSKSSVNLLDMYSSPIFRFGVSPNKLFDYFASGKPVISGLICDFDLVKRNSCGVVLGELTPEGLIDAIQNIRALSTSEYEKMSSASRKAAQNYDFAVLSEKLIDIINEDGRYAG